LRREGNVRGAKETRERILDTAEQLFSENGFSATSVRAITARAGVNVAALNYHFGSKSALIDAVFERRLRPLNQMRLRMLEQSEQETAPGTPNVERLLECFLGPPLRMVRSMDPEGDRFMRLMGRAHSEPEDFFRTRVARHFGEVFRRFDAAFGRTLPELPDKERTLRFHFVIGAMAHVLAHNPVDDFPDDRPGVADPVVVEEVLWRLIRFAAAGLRASVAPQTGERL